MVFLVVLLIRLGHLLLVLFISLVALFLLLAVFFNSPYGDDDGGGAARNRRNHTRTNAPLRRNHEWCRIPKAQLRRRG